MVKKKTDNVAEESAPIPENTEANEQSNPVPEETASETKSEIKNATGDIPAKAMAYLKRHPEDKEVYIDRYGGVFSANTPKVFVKDAVLYQNPYFKQ